MAWATLQNVLGLIAVIVMLNGYHPTHAIRVYWNTNEGPIVPPTSTPAPVPKPPFRDPAPVWEDQSDDIPNPNPYMYILPPPSRPKYNDITLEQRQQKQNQESTARPIGVPTTSSTTTLAPASRIIASPEQNTARPIQQSTYNQQQTYQNNVSNQQPNQFNGNAQQPQNQYNSQQQQPNQQQQYNNNVSNNQQNQIQTVPSLAVQYVPNQGFRYFAVVPVNRPAAPSKSAYLKSNDVLEGKYEQQRFDKMNGRYNAKLKKYKAYEKMKYLPFVMYYDAAKQQYIWSNLPPKATNNHL
ncbi:putative mediator of RNA polymerase II transcription subunit 15 [Uranotaenia lowii]|uniref:putative mediator of RNA polymerase II transcription subunit 15 n=1 Tax=Uranotaenia lowii TaxID=190385 RepID=UPI002478AA27|nr:putative mediator of RNA polymerase II transcription subunit 15 [Uranotaenia lowii]XP_055611732.1 putative mediator of RNA polymerase II transcription subunit 15 [Uranotaenia lowii]XP_055611733.1 putative mediator of RNA polymerase II transcription subunit 15 [Uranotaenia lowii]XP_055611735.1 putative mediator of RNA polymerase II transcription subunit 15 [Uranotaenia lowii]XP_055611736.1 putative mediator of RNA polymerase II transcription subunit 15 [Uranotaenia lowii]